MKGKRFGPPLSLSDWRMQHVSRRFRRVRAFLFKDPKDERIQYDTTPHHTTQLKSTEAKHASKAAPRRAPLE